MGYLEMSASDSIFNTNNNNIIVIYNMIKNIFYRALLSNGINLANTFDKLVSDPAAESNISLRHLFDETLTRQIHNGYIYYDSKRIPPNNSENSQINELIINETLTIKLGNDYIQCYALYPNPSSEGVITTVSSVEFAVNSAIGDFRGARRAIIDYDNDGTASWNPNGVKYARKITFNKC